MTGAAGTHQQSGMQRHGILTGCLTWFWMYIRTCAAIAPHLCKRRIICLSSFYLPKVSLLSTAGKEKWSIVLLTQPICSAKLWEVHLKFAFGNLMRAK